MGSRPQGGFSFYRIHIVDSLPSGELHTGQRLYEFLCLIPGNADHVSLEPCISRDEFFAALKKIRSDLEVTGEIPLIHIEAHGSADGLALASGEFLPWDDLESILTEVNMLCGLHLMVCTAACYGEHLMKVMDNPVERAPIWGCIGPTGALSAGAILDAFKAFYGKLLETSSLDQAMDEIGAALPSAGAKWSFWSAEYLFSVAFRTYLKQLGTPEKLDERARALAARLIRQGNLPPGDFHKFYGFAMAELRRPEHFFVRYKQFFFMIDLFPDNGQRFTLEYRDVAGIDRTNGNA